MWNVGEGMRYQIDPIESRQSESLFDRTREWVIFAMWAVILFLATVGDKDEYDYGHQGYRRLKYRLMLWRGRRAEDISRCLSCAYWPTLMTQPCKKCGRDQSKGHGPGSATWPLKSKADFDANFGMQ